VLLVVATTAPSGRPDAPILTPATGPDKDPRYSHPVHALAVALLGSESSSPSDWPPVLFAFVFVVVGGGAIITFNFFRHARGARRRPRRK
jgi:hypothetical protein